jgi:hypothetical protein
LDKAAMMIKARKLFKAVGVFREVTQPFNIMTTA